MFILTGLIGMLWIGAWFLGAHLTALCMGVFFAGVAFLGLIWPLMRKAPG